MQIHLSWLEASTARGSLPCPVPPRGSAAGAEPDLAAAARAARSSKQQRRARPCDAQLPASHPRPAGPLATSRNRTPQLGASGPAVPISRSADPLAERAGSRQRTPPLRLPGQSTNAHRAGEERGRRDGARARSQPGAISRKAPRPAKHSPGHSRAEGARPAHASCAPRVSRELRREREREACTLAWPRTRRRPCRIWTSAPRWRTRTSPPCRPRTTPGTAMAPPSRPPPCPRGTALLSALCSVLPSVSRPVWLVVAAASFFLPLPHRFLLEFFLWLMPVVCFCLAGWRGRWPL